MSDPNLPSDSNASRPSDANDAQPTTPLLPPNISEPQPTSKLPTDFVPGAPVPPPASPAFEPTAPPAPAAAQGVVPPQSPTYGQPGPGAPVTPTGAPQPQQTYGAVPPAADAPPVPPNLQYPQPAYAAGGYPAPKKMGLAISALIVGIVSLLFCFVPFIGNAIGILGGITAVVLGILAIKKAQSKGMSITGIITGGIATLIAVAGIIFWVFFIGAAVNSTNSALSDLEDYSSSLPTDGSDGFTADVASDAAASAAADISANAASEGASNGASDGAADGLDEYYSELGIEAGERSPEFCAAFNDFVSAPVTEDARPGWISALEKLATIDSPNQAVYERYLEITTNGIDAGATSGDGEAFAEAVTNDGVSCY
ncbi:DUF4190 domain-containing protein [Leucobacter musarum]|uniref:DUF4190 domain-containing protein n=1 Tax=Leucobacter musarum TaxID=1930747 RepID=UPI000A68B6C1|nr:DUF4190 domain-containing protein [Leucobacter musarum]